MFHKQQEYRNNILAPASSQKIPFKKSLTYIVVKFQTVPGKIGMRTQS